MVIFKLNSFLCFFLIITKDSNNKVNDPSAKFLQLLSKHKLFVQKSKFDIKLEVCRQMVDSSADECLLTFLMLTLLTESWVMKMFVGENIWKQVSDTDDTQLLRN